MPSKPHEIKNQQQLVADQGQDAQGEGGKKPKAQGQGRVVGGQEERTTINSVTMNKSFRSVEAP